MVKIAACICVGFLAQRAFLSIQTPFDGALWMLTTLAVLANIIASGR